ncbi:hypothetical protein LAZ67_2005419, partial [Cordylochernes scorpioides]
MRSRVDLPKSQQWRTPDDRPLCFHCGRPGHVVSKGPIIRVANSKCVRALGRCVLKINVNELTQPFEFIVLSECSHKVILGWDLLKLTQAKINCGENELYLKEASMKEELCPVDTVYTLEDSIIPPNSIKQIIVVCSNITGVQEVLITCSKALTLDKEIIIPASVVSLSHGRSKVWMANGSDFAKIIPAGMKVAEISLIDTSNSCCIDGDNDEFEKNENRCPEDLDKLVTLIDTDTSNEDRVRLLDVLRRYIDVFEFQKANLKTSSLKVKHCIVTGDHAPIKQRPYRVSPKERSIIQTGVDKMLKQGIIEPSDSPWSSPVVLVKKKDGTWRFCVDYRRLNKITRKDVYPLTRIDDTLDSLRGASIFSTMDLKSVYWKIEVDEADRRRPWLLVVPKSLRLEVLRSLHDSPTAGHLGFAKTYDRIRRRFYWPGLFRSVRNYVGHCRECQRSKSIPQLPPGNLKPIIPSSAPFQKIGVDLLGRFHLTRDGNRWVIVCTDYLTKYAITKAIPTGGAVEVARFILNEIILKHGAPREMITDRGRSFQAKLIKELIKMCRMSQHFTTAYHPQTNGLTERFNKTLGDMLSMYVDVEQKNWDSVLPFVTFAYNTARQETTGFSPFYLVHGREAETMLDTLLPYQPGYEEDEYINQLMTDAEDARQLARLHTLRIQDIDKARYDARHKPVHYNVGDLVWIFTPVRKVGLSEKLSKKYFGPYKITKKISDVNYEVLFIATSERNQSESDMNCDVIICDLSDTSDTEIYSYHDTDSEQNSEADEELPNDDSEFYFGKDGVTKWKNTMWQKTQIRTRSVNIISQLPGPKSEAKSIESESDAFTKIIDNEDFSRERDAKLTTVTEILDLFGLLIMSGVKRAAHFTYKELWAVDGSGVEIVRAIMSQERFLFLLRCLRFDDITTRKERKKLDKLAPIREFVEAFVYNCKKLYTPGEYNTIDKKLIPFRGRCGFRQYMPNKPAKYGFKIYTISDARTFYTFTFEIYCGKQPDGPYKKTVLTAASRPAASLNKPKGQSGEVQLEETITETTTAAFEKKEKSAKTRSRCPKCGGFTHREGQACRAEGQRSVEDSSNLYNDEGECRRRWTAEIQVNGKQVKFKLDSQADVTCVPLCLFKKIMGQQRLVESDVNIRAAEFSELQTMGMFISTLRNGNYEIKKKIYVIRRLSEPLLSRRACEHLNLARRIEVVATRINPIKEFPEVFEGRGQIGNPYEIKLKPGAKPYAVHTPRRVPIPLMEKLKTRLDIPGKELLDADALSRQPLLTTEGGENERPTSAHLNAVLSCITDKDEMLTKIFEAQQEDTTLKAVVNYLEQGWPNKKKMSQALLSYWHVKDELGVQNGLLIRSCRLVIPA